MKYRRKVGCGTLRHSTAGRLRIKLADLIGNENLACVLEKAAASKKIVAKSRARSFSGSLVVWYDPSENRDERVLEELEAFLEDFFAGPSKCCEFQSPRRYKRRSFSRTFGVHAAVSLVSGGILLFSLCRKLLGFAAGGRLRAAAAAAVASSIPMAAETLGERKKKKLFMFLTSACGLAIFSGHPLAALEILWLLSLGTLLEKAASEKAARAVEESLAITPEKAFLLIDGAEVETAVSALKNGDVLAACIGDSVCVDGVVEDGEALLDESRLTGQWEPCRKAAGDRVYAGSKVSQGSLRVRAEKTGDETYLRRLAFLVEHALENRTESERAADELARRLAKLGAVSTAITMIATRSFSRCLSVFLVMACPCASVLAASTAVAAAIANAARNHILVKDGRFLEKAGQTDVVCLDKTGTITSDMPEVAEIATRAPNQKPDAVLALAASAESRSRHPAAKALSNAAAERNVELSEAFDIEEFPGRGVGAKVGDDAVLVGNLEFMLANDVNDALALSKADIGMAMGAGGSETALEAADIAILNNDLDGIATLRKLSLRTLGTVETNFRIAVGTDMLGILLGAAGLLAPGTSRIMHIAHAVAIFFNSGRLLKD